MEEVKRSIQQNKEFHVLLSRLAVDKEEKKELVLQYTKGRTDHSSEMFFYEMEHMLRSMRAVAPSANAASNTMRRKILSIAHRLGWESSDGSVDMDRLNHFLLARGIYKKPLMAHNNKELISLVTQMEKVLEKSNHV